MGENLYRFVLNFFCDLMTASHQPRALILGGYGINCEDETIFAFQQAQFSAEFCHVNDLLSDPKKLANYQVLALPGGFSYGDHTGAGKALANRLREGLSTEVLQLVQRGGLVIGICNGFQVLVNWGLLPQLPTQTEESLPRQAALIRNNSVRYQCEWIMVAPMSQKCLWTKNLKDPFPLPIAHGEGKFYAENSVLDSIEAADQVAFRYCGGNPNGSQRDIAGITDPSGQILGLMPHPERALSFTNLPDWNAKASALRRAKKPLPTKGPGKMLFEQAYQALAS